MPAAGSLSVDSAEDAEALHLKHFGLLEADVGQRALAWASGYFVSPGFGADWLPETAFP